LTNAFIGLLFSLSISRKKRKQPWYLQNLSDKQIADLEHTGRIYLVQHFLKRLCKYDFYRN